MESKNLRFTKHALCALLAVMPICELRAQPANQAPPAAQPPAGELETLFADAEAAFVSKDYPTAVTKLEELLKKSLENKGVPDATLEMVRFNIGLGYLLQETPESAAKAETAFTECLVKHPKGEYASRCSLGIGRACILQGTPEKKEKAIAALRVAAADPRYRSEAGLALGQVYSELGREEEAFKVFRTLMGSDVRTPAQTGAAVEVIRLLANSSRLDDLTAYLDRVINQPGIRDAISWYTNEMMVLANELSAKSDQQNISLALYRSIQPRRQILATQKASLEEQQQEIARIEAKIKSEVDGKVPIARRSPEGETIGALKGALELNTKAYEAVEKAEDLDADLLIGRGRNLYYLDRFEEALVCFKSLQTLYPGAKSVETAAYSEIVIYNMLKDTDTVQKLATEFVKKHSTSPNLENVALLAGQGLEQAGKWEEMIAFYKKLGDDFPNSKLKDRYRFFEAYGLFRSGKFAEARDAYSNFLKEFEGKESELNEPALYQLALCDFVQGKYKETLASCEAYLKKYPEGTYVGDIRYRLAYIDFHDKEDQSEKMVKEITAYTEKHTEDDANGMLYNLLGDTYSQKKKIQEKLRAEKIDPLDKALEAYLKAVNAKGSEEVKRYAVEQATGILQGKKDWNGIAQLHEGIRKAQPNSSLGLYSAGWVVRMMVRENRGEEAAALLAETLKENIDNPANEQVEPLIDEMVRTLVPKRMRGVEINPDEIFQKMNAVFDQAAAGKENPTTFARKNYAGARLFELLRLPERSDDLLRAIALNSPAEALSPMLLSACGEILLKSGEMDKAEAMFMRIVDRFQDSQFADAGPVGLGQIALAKKEYQKALEFFDTSLSKDQQGNSRFREANIGRIEALMGLGKLDDAEKLGISLLGDSGFRGEPGGQIYLLLGDIFKAQAALKSSTDKEEALKKSNGYYQNAYARFKAYPDIAAEGLLRSSQVLKEMNLNEEAATTLKILLENEKFKNTPAFKKAK